MTASDEWDVGRLMGVTGQYWQASALHTGVKLDIFTEIGEDKLQETDVAQRVKSDERGVTMLLNSLAAMGLLIKSQAGFANTDFGKSYLVKDAPYYSGHIIMHHYHLAKAWVRLDQAVISGNPVSRDLENEEAERESFLLGMFNIAMGMAPDIAKQISLDGRKRLLDLGGGPGTYAIFFCLENPDLKATIYDFPTTRPFARKTIERFGLSNRIDFVEGNAVEDEIHGKYDAVWISHLFHAMGPDACQRIVDKTADTLQPGGTLLVHEFILDNTFDSPLFPALFSLNMLINTERGQSYSEAQLMEMLNRAGLKDIHRLPYKGPSESGIIQAFK